MADTVGAIYVKVIADTSGMKKQIEASLGKKSGAASGALFGTAFEKELEKRLRKVQYDEAIRKQSRAAARKLSDDIRRAVESGVDVADLNLDEAFGDEINKIRARFHRTSGQIRVDLLREIPAAFKEISTAAEKEANKVRLSFEESLSQMTLKRAVDRIAREFVDGLTPEVRQSIEKGVATSKIDLSHIRDAVRRLSTELNIPVRDIEEMVGRRIPAAFDAMARDVKRAARAVDHEVAATMPDSVGRLRLFVNQFNRSIASMQVSLRRMGTGGFFDSLTNLAAGFVGIFGKVDDVFLGVRQTAKSLGSSVNDLGNKLISLGAKGGVASGQMSALGGILKQVGGLLKNPYVAAAAAIAAVTVGLRALVGALSAIPILVNSAAAVLTMLGSAIYLTGANLAYALPLLAAFGTAIGALVVGGMDATKSMVLLSKAINESDPEKKAEALDEYVKSLRKLGPNARSAVESMRPLIAGFNDLKKATGERLFDGFAAAVKRAMPLFSSIKFGLGEMADAVGDVLRSFLDLGKDTAFLSDMKVLWVGMAEVVRDLGVAARDVLAGLAAVFSTTMPLLTEFTQGIREAAERFKEWSQSEDGRNRILEFFDKAAEVGGKVWDIVRTLAGAFHDLFTGAAAGEGGGQTGSLLDTILEKATALRDFIRKANEDGDLERWLQEGADIAATLWGVLVDIGKAFQSLNTEQNREWVKKVIKLIGDLIGVLDSAMRLIMTYYNYLKLLFQLVTGQWGKVKDTFEDLRSSASTLSKSVSAPFAAVGKAASSAIGWVSSLVNWVNTLIRKIRSIPRIPNPVAGGGGGSWGDAAGAVVMGPSVRLVGEQGPEAIIPLYRPLDQVAASVRKYAEAIRGHGPVSGGGVSITNHWSIQAATQDPSAVATQVMNRMVAGMA